MRGSLKGTGAGFEQRTEFSSAETLQGSFGPWSGRKERVRLRFEPKAAAFVAEKQVHPSQRLQWRSDGELDLEMELPVGAPLVSWVLGWGAAVRVLAPKSLAKRVREEHRRAAQGL